MDPAVAQEMLRTLNETNVTNTIHNELYDALLPSRHEFSQAGKVVLVTGGGTGVGNSIARSFVQASADTVIIVGRRLDILTAAASDLEREAQETGTGTKIIARKCDLVDSADVEDLWKDLASRGITVDIYVANAAKFTEPKPMLELGADEVWSQVEVNVKAPLYFAEKFCSQPGDKQKFIVNISTAAIHMTEHPGVAVRPAYTFSKNAGTLFFQLLAQDNAPEKVQITSFNPGTIYADGWKPMGIPPHMFDDVKLCGAFAVWLATKEAQFLHGRFLWSAWDINELSTGKIRKRIEDDHYFLRLSVSGIRGGLLM